MGGQHSTVVHYSITTPSQKNQSIRKEDDTHYHSYNSIFQQYDDHHCSINCEEWGKGYEVLMNLTVHGTTTNLD